MKTVKKNVYFCEFCKKRSLAGWAMMNHEKHCTANPNRECRTCLGQDIIPIIEAFKQRFKLVEIHHEDFRDYLENSDSHKVEWIGEPVTLTEIENSVDGCPNCTLAVLRQTGMNRHYFHLEFNYKATLSDWMAEARQQRREESYP